MGNNKSSRRFSSSDGASDLFSLHGLDACTQSARGSDGRTVDALNKTESNNKDGQSHDNFFNSKYEGGTDIFHDITILFDLEKEDNSTDQKI